jgi:hypothetical protein
MTKGQIRLPSGRVLATVEVEPAGELLLGKLIDLENTVEAALFTEYEHAVLSQLLVEVEQLDARITGLSLLFISEQGVLRAVDDLQLYPLQRTVSFSLRASGGGGVDQ